MALTLQHIKLLNLLKQNGLIGHGKSKRVLDIGQQNWFGDVDPNSLFNLDLFKQDIYMSYAETMTQLWREKSENYLFEIAYIYYQMVFDLLDYCALDLHGTERAKKCDLNEIISFEKQYDVVTNFGTAEHIFNQFSVFTNIHNLTAPQGLMMHNLPHQGAYNHGFYNYQPTFFFDLASINGYEVIAMALNQKSNNGQFKITNIPDMVAYENLLINDQISKETWLTCVMRKGIDNDEFKAPQQGVYGINRTTLENNWSRNTRIGAGSNTE